MVAFTATLRVQWLWVFLGAGFAVYFLQHLARRAAKK
jgi:hypothetical protein